MVVFLALQCARCETFQVQQEKKSRKWQCKICGEKQSVRKVFISSNRAKDCRVVVQKFNQARCEAPKQQKMSSCLAEDEFYQERCENVPRESKWILFNDNLIQDEGEEKCEFSYQMYDKGQEGSLEMRSHTSPKTSQKYDYHNRATKRYFESGTNNNHIDASQTNEWYTALQSRKVKAYERKEPISSEPKTKIVKVDENETHHDVERQLESEYDFLFDDTEYSIGDSDIKTFGKQSNNAASSCAKDAPAQQTRLRSTFSKSSSWGMFESESDSEPEF